MNHDDICRFASFNILPFKVEREPLPSSSVEEFGCMTIILPCSTCQRSCINKYNVCYGTLEEDLLWVEEDFLHEVNVLISLASWAALLLVCLLTWGRALKGTFAIELELSFLTIITSMQ